MVLEMQHRRKSGREVGEMFFLSSSPPPPSKSKPSSTSSSSTTSSSAVSTLKERERERELWVGTDRIMLLDDHPLFAVSGEAEGEKEEGVGVRVRAEDLGATFDLGLTEKQRRAREGVVLPYYDAQRKREGEGEGGRILYDMGREDDFDEEEDEI